MKYYWVGRKSLVVATSLVAIVSMVALAFTPAISDQAGPFLRYFGIVTCNSSSPCMQDNNAGSGAGLEGKSSLGAGAVGVTTFSSTSASNGKSGIFGSDLSTAGRFDDGVRGLSVRGDGVLGSSTSGFGVVGTLGGISGLSVSPNAAVLGDSATGNGVTGLGINYSGIVGLSQKSHGIDGGTQNESATSGYGAAGVNGIDESSDGGNLNSGVEGVSTNGIGVTAISTSDVGANVIGGSGADPALSVIGHVGADLVDACAGTANNPCTQGLGVFSVGVDGTMFTSGCIEVGVYANYCYTGSNGNVNITGQYQKYGQCVLGCAASSPTRPGRAVVSYVGTQSLPTIEDFGEATLRNGYTYVRLDSAFANVIDRSANYLVFITPEGDSRGLFVTQKSTQGFAVRENMSGHSSLAFSYRILAKPLGKQEQRLPMVAIPKLQVPTGLHRRSMPAGNR